MNNKWLVALLGAGAMALSTGALAQQGPTPGFYVGADVGSFDSDAVNDDDTAFKILGGYQINRNIAAELAYGMLYDKGGFEITTWELSGIYSLPLGNKFSVFGRLGFAMWDAEGGGFSRDGTDLLFGLGGQYDLTNKLGIRLQWTRYDVDDEDADLFSLGVIYRF
jgi:hypothetical protein